MYILRYGFPAYYNSGSREEAIDRFVTYLDYEDRQLDQVVNCLCRSLAYHTITHDIFDHSFGSLQGKLFI